MNIQQLVTRSKIVVENTTYNLELPDKSFEQLDDRVVVFPTKATWQEPVVEVGQEVKRRELSIFKPTSGFSQSSSWYWVQSGASARRQCTNTSPITIPKRLAWWAEWSV